MDDNEIIAACLRGGREGFRDIVDRHQGPALAMALNILRNRQDAEDICQEAFVQAFRSLAQFDPRRSFRTWLFTILYRKCLDLLKRKRRFQSAFARVRYETPLNTYGTDVAELSMRITEGATR